MIDRFEALAAPPAAPPDNATSVLADRLVTAAAAVTNYEWSDASATFSDVHANAEASFTVPSSGAVVVAVSAYVIVPASRHLEWNVHDGSGLVLATSARLTVGPGAEGYASAAVAVSGLTPGASKTFRMQARDMDTSGTYRIRIAGGQSLLYGHLRITVSAADDVAIAS